MTKEELRDLIKDILRDELRRHNLSDSRLANSAKVEVGDEGSVTLLLQDYAEFVDKGRKPGKPAPPGAILEWIRRMGIRPQGISRLSLAFAISRAIGKRGIQPRPFLQAVADRVEVLQEMFIENLVEETLSIITETDN